MSRSRQNTCTCSPTCISSALSRQSRVLPSASRRRSGRPEISPSMSSGLRQGLQGVGRQMAFQALQRLADQGCSRQAQQRMCGRVGVAHDGTAALDHEHGLGVLREAALQQVFGAAQGAFGLQPQLAFAAHRAAAPLQGPAQAAQGQRRDTGHAPGLHALGIQAGLQTVGPRPGHGGSAARPFASPRASRRRPSRPSRPAASAAALAGRAPPQRHTSAGSGSVGWRPRPGSRLRPAAGRHRRAAARPRRRGRPALRAGLHWGCRPAGRGAAGCSRWWPAFRAWPRRAAPPAAGRPGPARPGGRRRLAGGRRPAPAWHGRGQTAPSCGVRPWAPSPPGRSAGGGTPPRSAPTAEAAPRSAGRAAAPAPPAVRPGSPAAGPARPVIRRARRPRRRRRQAVRWPGAGGGWRSNPRGWRRRRTGVVCQSRGCYKPGAPIRAWPVSWPPPEHAVGPGLLSGDTAREPAMCHPRRCPSPSDPTRRST